MEAGYLIALSIGIIGSTVIHLSQGMMRLGIKRKNTGDRTTRTRMIYGVGVALNFTAPLWVIIANRFGPTVLYTSMYASGLIALLFFSCHKLGHELQMREITGSVFIVAGTVFLGFDGLTGQTHDMSTVHPALLLITGALAIAIIWPISVYSRRFSEIPQGLMFGLLGGLFLAIDSLLKGVAQYDTGSAAFLPSTETGIILFILSFIGAIAAFGMTQWAHMRAAPPSVTIAGYDAAYVALPVILVPLAAGAGFTVSFICYVGLGCLCAGLYLIVGSLIEQAQ